MGRRRDRVAQALGVIAPGVPAFERAAILDHAEDSPGLHVASPQAAAWAALTAFVRHELTEYDSLLAEGYDADAARHFVRDEMERILAEWGCRHPLDGG